MIPTIIIDEATDYRSRLEAKVRQLCPSLTITHLVEKKEIFDSIRSTNGSAIIFWNPKVLANWYPTRPPALSSDKTSICITDTLEYFELAMHWRPVCYLLNPVEEKHLVMAVEVAREVVQQKLLLEKQSQQLAELLKNKKEERLIGIPTIEGVEIILVDEVIRCEGLQKSTRIVTCSKKDIISAYNIGEFKKLLLPFGSFFSPHRSHLINLLYVAKYHKAGTIFMKDGSKTPITNDNKFLFLRHINSLR